MLKKIVHRLLRHRHFWRDAGFDELSEIYVAMMFRSLALSLIGIFVPVFLLKTGYVLSDICIFYIFFFVARTIMDVAGGYLVARIGPKHTMVISYAFQIVAASLFLTLPEHHWPLILPALLWGSANSLFYISFHVDFSKIKHSDHGGKELGYVTVMERIGATIGPVTGGILAMVFGPQYIFLIAIILMLIGLVPLFRTAEPVKTHQHLDFKSLKLLPLRRDLVSYCALTIEQNLCVALWPIFLTLFVFRDNIYATLGALSSFGILVSVLASFTIGKLIDRRLGGKLLRAATIGNALVYCVRPFVRGVPMVLGVNMINEVLTVGYRLPYYKGLYDAADDLPGYRIVYIVVMESLSSFAKLIVWVELFLLAQILSNYGLLLCGFAVASLASLLIMVQRYKALAYTRS